MSKILETVGVHKCYPMGSMMVHALRGIDFTVERGEFVAIMGPSGSGKSTLLHLLGGLDLPSEGEVLLGDLRLARLDDDKIAVVRRRQVGFVFQFFNLLPTLTAAENVGLPLLIDGRWDQTHEERVAALLALVGLRERAQHRPAQLSGGEQQRVAIARALVTSPLVVLADEPTGNLDSDAGATILQLLRRACDEQQQTIVMVTHDAQAAAYADRVVQLRDGQIAL